MPTRTHLACSPDPSALPGNATLVVVGRRGPLGSERIRALVPVPAETWTAMLDRTEPGPTGGSTSTWIGERKVVLAVLPEACSRHMSTSRAWAVRSLVKQSGRTDVGVLVALTEPAHAFATVLGVARAYPLYDHRSGESHSRTVTVVAVGPEGPVDEPRLQAGADGVRLAARLVDAPASELHTDAFVAEAEAVAAATGAELQVIHGTDLRDGGFGGL